MFAAIYARKSTDQGSVADDQKSVARQVDHARAYAHRKGWIVADEHLYVDDGVSGAEFNARPGFVRLMNALMPRPAFQVLVMSEESRLGREAIETAYALKQIVTADVRVFFYLEDRERTLESATDKLLMSVTAFADEMEREKARLRVTDAMVRKARAGHCCGGKVFGYDNVEVLDLAGRRSHVERVINQAEAAIVRRIFALSTAGSGYSRIAKHLNAECASAPRPKAGRPVGWSPSTVKVILGRRLYLGDVIWNRTRKRDSWGQARPLHRPETEWIRTSVPALRIVTDSDWLAAHRRLSGVRARLEEATGAPIGNRRSRDIESRYLLSGFARCAVCGGTIGVMSGSHSSNRRHAYGCIAYLKRGTSVCGNALRVPIDRVDDAVLRTLSGDVLRPAVVMAIVNGVLDSLESRTAKRDASNHRLTLRAIEREIANLAQAVATGGQLEALLCELRIREARRAELLTTIAAYEALTVVRFDRRSIEQDVKRHLDDWRGMLAKHTSDGRQLLREVLTGPLRFTPEGRTYRFEGEASVGRLLAGVVDVATFMVPVRGFEPRSRG
jgi:site-specific DNA recombinase